MGSDDNWRFGKEPEINSIADVCKAVGEFVKDKYGADECGITRDWTGIGEFVVFYKDLKRTLNEQKIDLFSEEEIEEEWNECTLDDDAVAIWWPEIEWAHKIPSEVWQLMLQEGKRLGIQQLIESMIHEFGLEDKKIFELLAEKLKTQAEKSSSKAIRLE